MLFACTCTWPGVGASSGVYCEIFQFVSEELELVYHVIFPTIHDHLLVIYIYVSDSHTHIHFT